MRIADHRNLNNINSELLAELRDQHLIMKLIVSEKLINTYQNNEPSITPLKGINEQIESLIDQSEKYTDSEK